MGYKLRSLDTSFHSPEDDQRIWSKCRKLSSHQVDSREPSNLSSSIQSSTEKCPYILFVVELTIVYGTSVSAGG